PEELLEIFDAAGRATGRAESRAAVHLEGQWHQAFHCWIVRHHRTEVVLQRRALTKDTFAGLWDASAAGHWRFGERPEEAAREIAEELGIDIAFSELVYRGRERSARSFANGLIDREHHQVYVLECDWPLSDYRPDPREVVGVAAFPAAGLLDLAAGRQPRLPATEAVSVGIGGRLEQVEVVVERTELVPYSVARLRRMLGRLSKR
ncbi:MAG: NUDIX domain-containing protein, partial [Chloroflexota bacterium]|nr:NUDIX domain-containing protein [Chloroflexota bacterium]